MRWKSMNLGRLASVLCAAASLGSCARSQAPDRGKDELPNEAVEEARAFVLSRAQASCDHGFECGLASTNEQTRCLLNYADVELLPDLEAALRAGRTRLNPTLAADCLRLSAEGCSFQVPRVCHNPYEGTLGEGEPCTTSEECSGQALCGPPTDGPDQQHCVPLGEHDSPCVVPQQCASRPDEVPVCVERDGAGVCAASVTSPDGDDGEPCGTWLDGDQWHHAGCNPGLYCLDSTCTPTLDLGEECEPVNRTACGPNAECVGVCEAIIVQPNAGDPCGFRDDHYLDCDARTLACAGDTCQPKGNGQLGDVCDYLQSPACAAGYCSSSGYCKR